MSTNQRIKNHVIAFNRGASLIVTDEDRNRWIMRRYGKVHACQAQLDQCAADLCLVNNGKGLSEFPQHEFTTPALAMPDGCKRDCPVHSYRRCIALKVLKKPDSFVWDGDRAEPEWLGAAVAEVDADRQKDPQAFE